VKKADADRADKELDELRITNTARMEAIDQQMKVLETERQQSIDLLKRGLLSGPAARLEALHRLTEHSDAIAWANLFIILLFIMVECSPILVKLLSEKGPYDSLLRQTEHGFVCRETEGIALASTAARAHTQDVGAPEKAFIDRRLNAELK
nr:DUF4407 domain-containing protein [Cyclobacteriaceae bacterium]